MHLVEHGICMIQMLASTYNSRKHVTHWVYMCFHKFLQNKSCMEESMNSIRHTEPSQLRHDILYKILRLFFKLMIAPQQPTIFEGNARYVMTHHSRRNAHHVIIRYSHLCKISAHLC